MKNLTIVFCLLFSINSFSQSDEEAVSYANLEQEIGLNISQFVNQFLSFNSNVIPSQPYLLTYKSTINQKNYFRAGLGFSFSGIRERQDNADPAADDFSTNIRLRLGTEKHWDISSRWLLTYGVDFPLQYSNSSFRSIGSFQDVRFKTQRLSAGGGPVIGFHYKFNDKVKVGTEATMYLNITSQKRTTVIDDMEQDTIDTFTVSSNLTSPIAIYFAFTI